jgi:hypothetical protein
LILAARVVSSQLITTNAQSVPTRLYRGPTILAARIVAGQIHEGESVVRFDDVPVMAGPSQRKRSDVFLWVCFLLLFHERAFRVAAPDTVGLN